MTLGLSGLEEALVEIVDQVGRAPIALRGVGRSLQARLSVCGPPKSIPDEALLGNWPKHYAHFDTYFFVIVTHFFLDNGGAAKLNSA